MNQLTHKLTQIGPYSHGLNKNKNILMMNFSLLKLNIVNALNEYYMKFPFAYTPKHPFYTHSVHIEDALTKKYSIML